MERKERRGRVFKKREKSKEDGRFFILQGLCNLTQGYFGGRAYNICHTKVAIIQEEAYTMQNYCGKMPKYNSE